jgi:hypothetical protein
MFHIFSGPLFANLESYAFLDLLIWGVSPILFELCRIPLKGQIKPLLTDGDQYGSTLLPITQNHWYVVVCVGSLYAFWP